MLPCQLSVNSWGPSSPLPPWPTQLLFLPCQQLTQDEREDPEAHRYHTERHEDRLLMMSCLLSVSDPDLVACVKASLALCRHIPLARHGGRTGESLKLWVRKRCPAVLPSPPCTPQSPLAPTPIPSQPPPPIHPEVARMQKEEKKHEWWNNCMSDVGDESPRKRHGKGSQDIAVDFMRKHGEKSRGNQIPGT